ncbi:MAG: hypothetical protein LBU76_06955 [Azoarcus sp.]|jgi:hypothetical protein|nr:hypothetical protein [Azoarcus sp.]
MSANKKKAPNELRLRNSTAEFLTFAYQTGGDGVEVRVQDGTIWLSQKTMGELFDTSSDNISYHLKNINKEGELDIASVIEEFSVTAADGKDYVENERHRCHEKRWRRMSKLAGNATTTHKKFLLVQTDNDESRQTATVADFATVQGAFRCAERRGGE